MDSVWHVRTSPVDKPAPSPHATDVPNATRRAVVLGIAVLIMVHSFLIMVWVMPVNPIRDAVGQQRVAAYINPYFEQSWSVFAPTPRRGGENVLVRAYYGKLEGSKETDGLVTDWFDITADEDRRITYLVNPSRFHSATRRLGGNINSGVSSFNANQRKLIAGNYAPSPRSELAANLASVNTNGPVGQANIDAYIRNDEMLTRFATMYATARWGDGVTAIQFRVGHRSVPNYSVRKTVKFLDVPFSYYVFGWRTAMPGNADAQAAFDAYVDSAPQRVSGTGK